MAQKSRFKMQLQGITEFRKTFPQLPGCLVKNPTYIQTAHGFVFSAFNQSESLIYRDRNRLLTSGWWAYSRKPVGLSPMSSYLLLMYSVPRIMLQTGRWVSCGVLSLAQYHLSPTFTPCSSSLCSFIVVDVISNGMWKLFIWCDTANNLSGFLDAQ